MVGASCLISMAGFKIVMNQLYKSDLSTVPMNSNIYSSEHGFDEFYGGDTIKEKLR